MSAPVLTYDALNTADLRGSTLGDYLVSIDAEFRLLDGNRVVYEEHAFPVVELARSLLFWSQTQASDDFLFDSMSFEEVGSVTLRNTEEGWTFGSVFSPATSSRPVSRDQVEQCIMSFVAMVERDLAGAGIDPKAVFRR